jgi:hypothetical protein
MSGNILFMIEGGKALDLVKQHIEDKLRVARERNAIARELGIEDIYVSNMDGTLLGVLFKGDVHPDFKKPDRKGRSSPKKGTEWAKRFEDQKGFTRPTNVISEAFDVPLSIGYSSADGEWTGHRCIGNPFHECGFLHFGKEGPFAMWVPDVPGEVAESEKAGQIVEEPAKSFKLEFDGCRRIEPEEWEILVAQHKLAEKKAKAAELTA